MCNRTEQVSHFDSVERQKGKHWPDHRIRVHAHVCRVSGDVAFLLTRVLYGPKIHCTHCQYRLYTVHCIMTVLLNHTISGKIGMDVVT